MAAKVKGEHFSGIPHPSIKSSLHYLVEFLENLFFLTFPH